MAYNIAVPPANVVPMMGRPFMMPPANAVIGGNVMVPPATPLMNSYVVPTTNLINGNMVVPTTSHVIGPPGGIVMGGGFVSAPCNPSLIGQPISVPPGWNPTVDYSRKTAEVIEYLGRQYDGLLRCKKCQHHVAFDSKAIFVHDQQCSLIAAKSKASESVRPKPNSLVVSDPRSLSTIDAFKRFVQNCPDEMRNANISPPPSEWMSSFLDQVDRTSFIIKQFDCLSCLKSGGIVHWEEHALQFHRVCQETSDADEQFEITCICFVCNALLFGTHKLIQKHTHRAAGASSIVNVSNAVALYPNWKCNEALLRYYRFEMTNADPTTPAGISFYCAACDCYGPKKPENHFSSFGHNALSVVSDDPRKCDVCKLVISSDALLMAVHRLTPSHLQRKNQDGPKAPVPWNETNIHRELMELLQQRLGDYHFDSVSQRLAYYCDMCECSVLEIGSWRSHKESKRHRTKKASNSRLDEYSCFSCKVTLLGTFDAYLGHMTTKGHKLVKRAVVYRHNMQQLQQPQVPPSTAPRPVKKAVRSSSVSNPPLSELLHSALLGDDGEAKNESSVDTEASAQHQQVKEMRARRERYDSETASLPTNSEKHRVSLLKVRSESESSAVSQKKTTAIESNTVASSTVEGVSKHATELRFSKTIVKSVSNSKDAVPNSKDPSQTTISNTTSVGAVSLDACENLRPTRRSLSVTPSTNRGSGKSEDDESDCFYDCNSAASESENDVEMKGIRDREPGNCENEKGEKEIVVENGGEEVENDDDDENDLCDEILASNETECNHMLSDEEMDASVLEELKNDAASGLNGAQLGEKTDENNSPVDEEREIVRHLIVIRGIPKQALQNKRIMHTTFSKFGEIRRTYVKKNEQDSLYILVLRNPEVMFHKLKDNLIALKTKLGAEEISVEYDTRSSNGPGIRIELSKEAQSMLSDRNKLGEAILSLMQTYENESRSAQSMQRIRKLENAISDLAFSLYDRTVRARVHMFGSRVTGLATDKSDVDIYLQLGDSFTGCMHTNTALQQQLVVAFSNAMKMTPKHFQNVISVPFARVPIVKFTDVCSGLNCDLSFKSGLSTMNSILVRSYLSLDARVKYLVCAVKLWMKLNNFADRHLFTTYAQIWMVLFFLMQPEIAVVPTVLKLRLMLPIQQQVFDIEGWNCAFPNINCIIWRSACVFTNEELLTKFFEFYSNFNLKNYVLCTLTGIKTEKKYFLEFSDNLPLTFAQYRFKVKADSELYNKIIYDFEGLCVQDPFDHSHNLTKTINLKKFQSLTEVCRQTVDILKNT